MQNSDEFIWHYKIDYKPTEEALYDDPIVEMIRTEIQNLLQIVVLTKDGTRVQINGFKFHKALVTGKEDVEYKIWG